LIQPPPIFPPGRFLFVWDFLTIVPLIASGNGADTRLKQGHHVKQTLPETNKELSRSGQKPEKTSRICQPHQSWAKVVR
jgi:hypothetical protein